jgi:hypothetical protein
VRTRILCASLISALLIAACGGSSKTAAQKKVGPYGPHNSPYAVSKCMRANGVSHFPDPSQGSGGLGFPGGLVITALGQMTVDGISFSGPALKRAEQACKTYLPGGGGPAPGMTAQQRAAALKLAQCMRTHGVPSFPDPGSGVGGPGAAIKQKSIPDASTPAFKHAISVCGRGGVLQIRGGNAEGP